MTAIEIPFFLKTRFLQAVIPVGCDRELSNLYPISAFLCPNWDKKEYDN